MTNGSTTVSQRWWRRLLPVVIGLAGALLVLMPSPPADFLARRSYDTLHQLGGTKRTALDASPVIIVYIDRTSFQQMGLQEDAPWPRELHAQLLDRLTRDGARAVVMDVLFSQTGTNEPANAALAKAIRENGRVVLGEDIQSSTSVQADVEVPRLFQSEPPIEMLRTNAAAVALTATSMDGDLLSRRHFAGLPSMDRRSLAYSTAALLGIKSGSTSARSARWMRYYGPPRRLPHVSFSRALASDDLPADYFKDRVVFVGAQPVPGQFNERGDEWRNPFVGIDEQDRFMPGVEIHATQFLNLVRGDWLRRPDPVFEAAAFLAVGILMGCVIVSLRPVVGVPLVVGFAALFAWAAVLAMGQVNLWLAWMIPAFVQGPVAIAGGLTLHSVEWLLARRRAERRIREQAELIDKAQDAILLLDLDGTLRLANPRARTLFGLTDEEATPINFQAEEVVRAKRAVLAQGRWQGELQRQRSEGPGMVLASRWTLIRDAGGTPTGILCISTDITEQKQLEAQLIQAQRLETIGAIASGMAHDLNNSLAPLLMGVQLLRKRHTDEATRGTLDHMESSVRRGTDMVQQVLSLARGRRSGFVPIDLGMLMREMARLVRETFPENIRLEVQVATDLWLIEGDPTQLHQVLLNLCVNARDAMAAGGTLTLAADNVCLDTTTAARSSGAHPGDYVAVMVIDQGEGIAPEHVARLFEPFFTTKPEGKGTGLGLPTVKRIVEAHGGFINVSSAPGQGSSFEVFFPRAKATPAEVPAVSEIVSAGKTVLIVADQLAVRELLAGAVAGRGHRVLTSESASEALDRVARGEWRPDCLVLDLSLPGSEELELHAAFRRHLPEIQILFLGGRQEAVTRTSAADVALLRSPVDVPELIERIGRRQTKSGGEVAPAPVA